MVDRCLCSDMSLITLTISAVADSRIIAGGAREGFGTSARRLEHPTKLLADGYSKVSYS